MRDIDFSPDWIAERLALVGGVLTWRERPADHFVTPNIRNQWNARSAGKPAYLVVAGNGYPYVNLAINGARGGRRRFACHRLVWVLAHGRWPAAEIDHIDGDPRNFAIGNLREVTRSQNLRNAARSGRNTSGFVGVAFLPRRGRWYARITVDGKMRELGTFATKEDAIAERRRAMAEFGFSPRHGLPRDDRCSPNSPDNSWDDLCQGDCPILPAEMIRNFHSTAYAEKGQRNNG